MQFLSLVTHLLACGELICGNVCDATAVHVLQGGAGQLQQQHFQVKNHALAALVLYQLVEMRQSTLDDLLQLIDSDVAWRHIAQDIC